MLLAAEVFLEVPARLHVPEFQGLGFRIQNLGFRWGPPTRRHTSFEKPLISLLTAVILVLAFMPRS